MTEFTPLSALLGGAILGFSALLLLWFNGNIAGISGIISRAIQTPQPSGLWRWFFLAGLIIGPVLMSFGSISLPQQIDISWPMMLCGGLFVGIGSKLGSGCTSGHGICGIGRISTRSIVATCVFMAIAILVVFIVRQVIGA